MQQLILDWVEFLLEFIIVNLLVCFDVIQDFIRHDLLYYIVKGLVLLENGGANILRNVLSIGNPIQVALEIMSAVIINILLLVLKAELPLDVYKPISACSGVRRPLGDLEYFLLADLCDIDVIIFPPPLLKSVIDIGVEVTTVGTAVVDADRV